MHGIVPEDNGTGELVFKKFVMSDAAVHHKASEVKVPLAVGTICSISIGSLHDILLAELRHG